MIRSTLFVCLLCVSGGAVERTDVTHPDLNEAPGAVAVSFTAVTRDTSGNGFLDRIEVRFDSPLDLQGLSRENVSVTHEETTFSIAGLTVEGSTATGTVLLIDIVETVTEEPQTAWTPAIRFTARPDITVATETAYDGAGPVIREVENEIADCADPSEDRISVTFSEPLSEAPDLGVKAEELFRIFVRDSDKTLVAVDSLLSGNLSMFPYSTSSKLMFQMLNNQELTQSHYLGIRVDSATSQSLIRDRCKECLQANQAPRNNEPVRVKVRGLPRYWGNIDGEAFMRTSLIQNDDYLRIRGGDALSDMYSYGGVAVSLEVKFPPGGPSNLTGAFVVYDQMRNAVFTRKSKGNMTDGVTWLRCPFARGSTAQVWFYWNGIPDEPTGSSSANTYFYDLALTMQYDDSTGAPVIEHYGGKGTILVVPNNGCENDGESICEMEGDNSVGGCGSCGTGVGLAFLPPIGLRVCRVVRRRRKRRKRG